MKGGSFDREYEERVMGKTWKEDNDRRRALWRELSIDSMVIIDTVMELLSLWTPLDPTFLSTLLVFLKHLFYGTPWFILDDERWGIVDWVSRTRRDACFQFIYDTVATIFLNISFGLTNLSPFAPCRCSSEPTRTYPWQPRNSPLDSFLWSTKFRLFIIQKILLVFNKVFKYPSSFFICIFKIRCFLAISRSKRITAVLSQRPAQYCTLARIFSETLAIQITAWS